MRIGRILAVCISLTTVPAMAGPALAEEDGPSYPLVQQGADLAEMWCNACHVTGTGVTEHGLDAAPPFVTLAPLVTENPEYYRGFLTNPHYPMREISLSRDEILALLSYIQSLDE